MKFKDGFYLHERLPFSTITKSLRILKRVILVPVQLVWLRHSRSQRDSSPSFDSQPMEVGPIWGSVYSRGRKTIYCAESTQQGPMGHL
ncbi:uncharacterized protein LACBIDRAFT_309956 [Laccaria bicolor S238N-H82]|uniref:Predicted protein n=1 Tax=Laccaria bicolor (strain S238N-H82 / ATCC MYA-4686) TaxID=486041 RepID=B0E4U6_LACBS|nr:uncharacterized protein LACBIDRAFT_309956 [Laccaria bicolor S238N-H82]EDQ98135.1 predicted protein [Laccaria bicolor S238N-H82]|eukprot:XP_001891212.1 predicted protein [Laccaria bicolor S238N-H82]